MKPRLILRASPSGLVAFVLSALLAVQVATGFMPASASAGNGEAGFELVLCTGDGTRTITLPASDGDGDAPAAPSTLGGHCPLCILSVALPGCGFEPAEVARVALALRFTRAAADQTRGAALRRTDAIRAPPLTV